ncbi:MAG: DUF4342 domain-containing protein [Nitrososphaerota archaeon]
MDLLWAKFQEKSIPFSSEKLVKTIKKIIHEGNVTRMIVKNEKEKMLLEIPAIVCVIGALLAP